MNGETKEQKEMSVRSRRAFLRTFGALIPAVLGAGALMSGCGGDAGKGDSGEDASLSGITDCGDLSGVSEAELEKRKSLGYVDETPMPESHCGNCLLYLAPDKEGTCGGCQLFKGPVFEQGYCTYWAAKT